MINNKGEQVRQFFSSEAKALLAVYKNIETLIPSQMNNGSAHTGEEGRYIESIVRAFLNKHLPNDLKAFSGFIVRPAVKIGTNDRSRRQHEKDEHSKQLDIIIYDRANYPIYEQFEEFVIVPPEGVVAIISVKKRLYVDQINQELLSLAEAVKLCAFKNHQGNIVRAPNSCLFAFTNNTNPSIPKNIFQKIKEVHENDSFDECIGKIIVMDSYSVFKRRPQPDEKDFINQAEYVGFNHKENEYHLGLQFLLTGILSAYHHPTRNHLIRPGYTSFESGRKHDCSLGEFSVKSLRLKIPKN